jgi:hypothetical protein
LKIIPYSIAFESIAFLKLSRTSRKQNGNKEIGRKTQILKKYCLQLRSSSKRKKKKTI